MNNEDQVVRQAIESEKYYADMLADCKNAFNDGRGDLQQRNLGGRKKVYKTGEPCVKCHCTLPIVGRGRCARCYHRLRTEQKAEGKW